MLQLIEPAEINRGAVPIFPQMALMGLLLKRISRFIVKVTLAMRKMFSSNSTSLKTYLPGPDVPKFIANLIQRE
jgi:hypothetical protein